MPAPVPPVQDQLNALAARLTVLDGQGMTGNAKGKIDQLFALVAGLKKTLGNVNMGFQQKCVEMQSQITAFETEINSKVGG